MKAEVGEAVAGRAKPAPAVAPTASPKKSKKLFGIEIVDLLWLAIPVAFSLWALRSELINVEYLNDSAMHKQMVRWADARSRWEGFRSTVGSPTFSWVRPTSFTTRACRTSSPHISAG